MTAAVRLETSKQLAARYSTFSMIRVAEGGREQSEAFSIE